MAMPATSLHVATAAERLYAAKQPHQIALQSDYIGCMKVDVSRDGHAFCWENHRTDLKTDLFDGTFDAVFDAFIDEALFDHFMASDEDLRNFCEMQEDAMDPETGECYFRADRGAYSYLLACDPSSGEVDFYCYLKRNLDFHKKRAENGIRIVNANYKEQFRLRDGEKLLFVSPQTGETIYTCRYIDDSHLMVGENLYHSLEFGELIKRANGQVQPVEKIAEAV
jgi:hypothetical protein